MWKLAVACGVSLIVSCAADDGEPLAVEIGTHLAGASSPQAYAPLPAELAIVLGHQGLHMVVLAARLPDPPGSAVTVEAALTTAEGLNARLRLGRRPVRGADGADYLLNLFVILDDPARWQGQTAEVTVTVETDQGRAGRVTAPVVLVGG